MTVVRSIVRGNRCLISSRTLILKLGNHKTGGKDDENERLAPNRMRKSFDISSRINEPLNKRKVKAIIDEPKKNTRFVDLPGVVS